MWCEWCREHKEKIKMFIKKRHLIDGTTTFKLETIRFHEDSEAHAQAMKIHQNTREQPENAPATKTVLQLRQMEAKKMTLLFRNAHAVIKHRKPFTDYEWLCRLDDIKGLNPGKTYRTAKSAKTFSVFIAETERKTLREKLEQARFLSITSDGSTDCDTTEQEIVFVRFAVKGKLLICVWETNSFHLFYLHHKLSTLFTNHFKGTVSHNQLIFHR
jgi:hypothetical protein